MTLQGWYSRWQTLTAPTISGKATRSPGVCAKPAAFKVTVCWACDGACLLAEVPEQVLRELGSVRVQDAALKGVQQGAPGACQLPLLAAVLQVLKREDHQRV